jgi:hypothetical protein
MKIIHAALAATLVIAFSSAALAEGSSKATQLTEAQMAKIVAAGGAEVIKPDHSVTFVFNSSAVERTNDSSGRGFTTINVFTCLSAC